MKIDTFYKFSAYINSYNNNLEVQKKENENDKIKIKNNLFNQNTNNGASDSDDTFTREKKYVRGFVDEMKNNGVSLFKLTDDKTKWTKIESPDNEQDEQPKLTTCN